MTIQVKDLVRPELSEMSNSELLDYINNLRRRRGVKKEEPVKEKVPSVKSKSKLVQLKALLANMSAEERAQLGIGGMDE